MLADANYDNFVEDLKEAETLRQCRYGIYDAQYTLKDGQNRSKIVFFLWYVALVSLLFYHYCWRLNDIALLDKSSQSYGVSLAIWDCTPATRHKWIHPVVTPRLTYPGGMVGWVDLGDWLHTEIVFTVVQPSINPAVNLQPVDHVSEAQTTTLPSYRCVTYSCLWYWNMVL